jgi:hypothetical protein
MISDTRLYEEIHEQPSDDGRLLVAQRLLPGAVSGWIQTQLGYKNFFVWVVLAAIPALVLSRFIPIRGGADKAAPPAEAPATAS